MPLPPIILLLAFSLLAIPGLARPGTRQELTGEGLLVITAAQDSTRSFRWEEGPGSGQLSLVWPEGRLIIPSELSLQGDAQGDLGIPLRAGFGGNSPAGPVALGEGLQSIDANLAFSDGRLQWMVSGGELEIHGNRLIYRRPWVGTGKAPGTGLKDQRANLLMIAGLLLLIAVLLRRARRITRRKV